MKRTFWQVLFCSLLTPQLFLFTHTAFAQKKPAASASKQSVMASVDKQQPMLIRMSDSIWAFAETALKEGKSSKILADYAEAQGFRVERGVAEMPTAFIATYGSGQPIIGILGEFDALPGLSQQATPDKSPVLEGAPGHGCGHNLFGPASLGAATAIKELMQQGKLKGTIRFYGTPAEESIGGKIYMARAGLFNDLDMCFDWHPADKNEAVVQTSRALVDFIIKFKGKAAHASFDPWNGVSAVDAMEFYTHGLNYFREHVRPSSRIHYFMQKAGDAVNIVPDNAQIWTRLRDVKTEYVEDMYKRVMKIAEGAAMMAGATYTVELISGMHELIINRTGAKVLHDNMTLIGPISYTAEETAFAQKIQEATGKPQVGIDGSIQPLAETLEDPPGASSDVGDVSWIVPEISLGGVTAGKGVPWHSWAVVACGGMSIGHKGMAFSAKALAMTMVDAFENAAFREAVKKEFLERKGNRVYKPYIPDGPPPVKK
ncbi:MAG: amidohydrolase [Chitinophagaceae bacterium]|nr:amidohydrolase [Chitinophagaceae bacterium]